MRMRQRTLSFGARTEPEFLALLPSFFLDAEVRQGRGVNEVLRFPFDACVFLTLSIAQDKQR
jgi:hypothetical protein